MLGYGGLWFPSNLNFSSGCRDLLKRMIEHDSDLRMTFEEFY